MKPHRSIPAIALVFAVVTASQARAQVAWSSVASGCVLQSAGENLAIIDAAHGTVSFKTGTAGDIKMSCPVASLHQVAPNLVNDLHITFYMGHQPTHAARTDTPLIGSENRCFILVDLLRTNLNNVEAGASLATISISGHSFLPGRQELNQSLSELLDFNTSYYWIDIQLHRDPPVTTVSCNPEIVGTYLDLHIF
jgi:hypothetical protein